ncbi:Quinone oxidoreductase PIG3 [Geodia barretti]|uniref:Quinone oxidoreductase PIG3 n=1 Tax=Geodia barretti TaxID=519541 RepID=A0AA35WBM9_GEOBA|nr:Quinone oxidoreductase PIG3 [Geodia barretti]
MQMAIPETMSVVDITEPGPPEALQIGTRSVPVPGAGEVLIRVAAAGVNRADTMQRKGNYPPPRGASDIPGLEVSGTLAAVGERVSGLAVGDEAAALPEAYATVWTNVMDRGRLQAGESLLVHGGSSGIGTVAIQLAKLFGAHIFATAGTPAKCAACVELGAERAIDYRADDFVAVLHEATGGRGVDVILDMIGGAYLPRNVASLAIEGRLVIIALMEGAKAELDLARLMSRRLTVTGATLRARSIEQKAEIMLALRARVWPRFASNELRPIVHATYPLADAAEAHRVMESSVHTGKLLLIP